MVEFMVQLVFVAAAAAGGVYLSAFIRVRYGWTVVRCWEGQHALLASGPTKIVTFSRKAAERYAARLNRNAESGGLWYEVHRNSEVTR